MYSTAPAGCEGVGGWGSSHKCYKNALRRHRGEDRDSEAPQRPYPPKPPCSSCPARRAPAWLTGLPGSLIISRCAVAKPTGKYSPLLPLYLVLILPRSSQNNNLQTPWITIILQNSFHILLPLILKWLKDIKWTKTHLWPRTNKQRYLDLH